MQEFEKILSEIDASSTTISISKACVNACGDLKAGLLLSFLLNPNGYVPTIIKDGYEWYVVLYTDWWLLCCLTESQARRALKILEEKDYIVRRYYGHHYARVTHIRLTEKCKEEFS